MTNRARRLTSWVVAAAALTAAGPVSALACEGPVPAPGFAVAPAGDDGSDGGAMYPFRTLDRARRAMEEGSVRVTYVDGGVYALQAPLRLDSRDKDAAFLACPGQSPALDGGAHRLQTLVELVGASGVHLGGLTLAHASEAALTVQDSADVLVERNIFTENGSGIVFAGGSGNTACGNRVMRSALSGIEVKDGSIGMLLAHNIVDGTQAPATRGGGLFLHGTTGNAIVRNLVRNTRGAGIGVANWDATTVNTGIVIAGNVVRDTNRNAEDSGAIYLLGRSHADVHGRIVGNVIEDAGAPGDAHTIGIYLDDSTSGVVVENNIVQRPGTHGIEVHGGDDILIRNNLFDLGADATSAILFQAAPADTNPTNTMRNNQVIGNLFVETGATRAPYTFLDGGDPAISGNLLVSSEGLPGGQGHASADLAVTASASLTPQGRSALEALAAAMIAFRPIDTAAIGPDPSADCVAARRIFVDEPVLR